MGVRQCSIAAVLVAFMAAACSGSSNPPAASSSRSGRTSAVPPQSSPTHAPSPTSPPSPIPLPRGQTASVETDPYPFGVTVAFGKVWVTSHDGQSLQAIDPVTDQIVRTVGLTVQPGSVVSGAGWIWVQSRTDNTLIRVDPTTFATKVIRLGGSGSPTCSIAFGHGFVWVATAPSSDLGTRGVISRVQPSTGLVAARIPVRGFPCGFASVGAEEWTATPHGVVGMSVGSDAVHEVPVPQFQNGLAWLGGAVGGHLFVAVGASGGFSTVVYRIDPSKGTVTGILHRPSDNLIPLEVATTGIWFNSDGSDQILVVDPATMRVTAMGSLDTGEVITDPTMKPTELWLPDQPGNVVNIDPAAFLHRKG